MPSVAETLQNALTHHQQGRLSDAERIYRSIIRVDPDHPDALHLLGVVQQQRGDSTSAVDYISRAVSQLPKSAVYHSNLAAAYRSMGSLDRAAECLQEAVRLDPAFADAHYNLGTVLKDLGRPREAGREFQTTLQLAPDNANALNNLGTVCEELGDFELAVECYRKVLADEPNHPNARGNLGNALLKLGRTEAARNSYERAVAGDPQSRDALFGLGNWHRQTGDPEAAEDFYRKAREVDPNNAAVINNLGVSLKEQGRYDEALRCYDRAVELAPNQVEPRVNRSFLHRLLGDFPAGWKDYDWRLANDAPKRSFDRPRWDGSPLNGKSLLVHVEQGIGDQILFASCIPDVAAQAERVLLECEPRLAPLFRRSFPQAEVLEQTANPDWPPHDVQIHCGGLLPFLRPAVDHVPRISKFLAADPDRVAKWRKRYAELSGRLVVGLSWFGGKDAILQQQRSLSLGALQAVLEAPGVEFVNLQYGERRGDVRQLDATLRERIHDWNDADPLQDLDDFAAQIAALDLVVSIDNSTVHFAGGLGTPCFVMLPFVADWRWLRDRSEAPWYAGLRLFRQKRRGEWGPVVERIRQSLDQFNAVLRREPPSLRPTRPVGDSRPETPAGEPASSTGCAVTGDDRDWLEANRSLRWDPAVTNFPEVRARYHVRRYEFAREFCTDRGVLDVACGSGYGSSILAAVARQVTGVDACAEAVDFASRTYAASNLQFARSWAEQTPFPDSAFQVVVCFEALEHMLSPRAAMCEFARVLDADGIAVVSVPNAWGYTKHHLVDTDLALLREVAAEFFHDCTCFYNNSGERNDGAPVGVGPLEEIDPDKAECLIAVCKRPRHRVVANTDRTALLLDDAYHNAFRRHHEMHEWRRHSYGPLSASADDPRLPPLRTGQSLDLVTDENEGECDEILLRTPAEIVRRDGASTRIVVPDVRVDRPTVAQLHLIYRNGSIGQTPVFRLLPAD